MITLPTELLLRVAVCPAVKRLSALFERGGEVRVGGLGEGGGSYGVEP